MDALEHLGDKANVILANGAFDQQKEPDENKAARDELEKTAVHVSDRMVSSGQLRRRTTSSPWCAMPRVRRRRC